MSVSPGYAQALGFSRQPFPHTPDAGAYFRTPHLEQALAETLHCIDAHKGFVLVTGEVGTGKSTFSRRLMASLHERGDAVSLVFNTFLQGGELLAAIGQDFGLSANADAGINAGLTQINDYLLGQHDAGRTCVIVIDDAQNLSLESLELLRLLSNLETNQEKLVQIVLLGQPELLEHLGLPQIRQLTSRIVLHYQLSPLTLADTAGYIAFRLAAAGNPDAVTFRFGALRLLHKAAKGNPRRIHLIMDRCLYGVVARNRASIDRRLVRAAVSEVSQVYQLPVTHSGWGPAGSPFVWSLGAAALVCITVFVVRAVPLPGVVRGRDQPTVYPTRSSGVSGLAVAKGRAPMQPLGALATATNGRPWRTCLEHHHLAPAAPFIQRVLIDDGKLAKSDQQLLARRWHLWVVRLDSLHAGGVKNANVPCRIRRAGQELLLWHPAHPAPLLRYGESGKQVLQAQRDLQKLGLYQGALDGQAGVRTLRAVQRFQVQIGFTATGYLDPQTAFRLQTAVDAMLHQTASDGRQYVPAS